MPVTNKVIMRATFGVSNYRKKGGALVDVDDEVASSSRCRIRDRIRVLPA